MSKFRIGDQIVGNKRANSYGITKEGWRGVVTSVTDRRFSAQALDGRTDFTSLEHDDFDLITNGELPMKRRTFKLTKELPELTKGALVQEKCDDGTQDYIALDNSQIKYTLEDGRKSLTYPRKAVEDEPNYFVEVFAVEPAYMTQDELDQFEAFKISAKKPAKRTSIKTTAAKPVGRPKKVTTARKGTKA
ncbi:hypothetical protein [Rhodococcus erythropolis]